MYDIINTECRTWPRAFYSCLDWPVANLQIFWSPIQFEIEIFWCLPSGKRWQKTMERSTMLFSWENHGISTTFRRHFQVRKLFPGLPGRVHPWFSDESSRSCQMRPSRRSSRQIRPVRSWRLRRSLLRPAAGRSIITSHNPWRIHGAGRKMLT